MHTSRKDSPKLPAAQAVLQSVSNLTEYILSETHFTSLKSGSFVSRLTGDWVVWHSDAGRALGTELVVPLSTC